MCLNSIHYLCGNNKTMTRVKIDGQTYYKQPENKPLTTQEKKRISNKELVWSFYATGYRFYKQVK